MIFDADRLDLCSGHEIGLFRVMEKSWRKSGEQLMWAGFDVKVNESRLAGVLGGSVDLASRHVEQLGTL